MYNIQETKNLIATSDYDELRTDKRLGKNVVALLRSGSGAYGLETQNSDVDIRGFFTYSPENILTNTYTDSFSGTRADIKMYPIQSVIKTGSYTIPDILELLFFPEDYYCMNEDLFRMVRENRTLFLSKETYHAYMSLIQHHLARIPEEKIPIHERESVVDEAIHKVENDERLQE